MTLDDLLRILPLRGGVLVSNIATIAGFIICLVGLALILGGNWLGEAVLPTLQILLQERRVWLIGAVALVIGGLSPWVVFRLIVLLRSSHERQQH